LAKKQTPHSNLKQAVTQYLELRGFIVCNFFAGGARDRNGKYFPRKNTKGISDILACSPDGKFVAVELKCGKDILKPEQEMFLQNVNSKNGIGLVIRNIDEIMEAFN